MGAGVTLKRGDVVTHGKRPEWGDGVVDQADAVEHDGQRVQRVVVTFANHRRVTINTGIATLIPKGVTTHMSKANTPSMTPPANDQGWLASLSSKDSGNELWSLPAAFSDPFVTLDVRLNATTDSYRFQEANGNQANATPSARGLLDWAVAQTGHNDPLTHHTRHELEQAFRRFARDRDRHLLELVRTAKRQNQAGMIKRMIQKADHPAAKQALERALRS